MRLQDAVAGSVDAENHRLFHWILSIAAALAVPILPFLVFGELAESQMAHWLDLSDSPVTAAALVIGLLLITIPTESGSGPFSPSFIPPRTRVARR
jgi:hypothetical protein